MKQTQLLRTLRDIAQEKGTTLDLIRHGGRHDLYRINSTQLVVPRHREINERTANAIIATAEGA